MVSKIEGSLQMVTNSIDELKSLGDAIEKAYDESEALGETESDENMERLHGLARQYMSVLFRCRDDLSKCLATTEKMKKKFGGEDDNLINLEEYLNGEKKMLLSIFMDVYTQDDVSDDELIELFIDSLGENKENILSIIDLDEIPAIDKYITRRIGEKLFESIKKEDPDALGRGDESLFNLWGDDGSDIVEGFISDMLAPKLDEYLESQEVLDDLQNEICKEKGIKPTQEIYDFFHGGLDLVKKEYLKHEKKHTLITYYDMIDKMGDRGFSIARGGKSYILLFLYVLNKRHIDVELKGFISESLDFFLNKKGYEKVEGDMSFGLSLSIDQMVFHGGLSNYEYISDQVKQLLMTTFDKDLLLGIDDADVTHNEINAGLQVFSHSMVNTLMKMCNGADMKILMRDFDDDLRPSPEANDKNMELIYDRHRSQMNRYFINNIYTEVKKVWNKGFANLNEWSDEKKEEIIQSLYDKYPNASKSLRFKLQSKSKLKERKDRFLADYVSELKNKLEGYFQENKEELLKLKLVDFHILACFYVLVASKIIESVSLDDEFEKYVVSDLEPLFADTHKRNTERNRIEAEKNQVDDQASEREAIDSFMATVKNTGHIISMLGRGIRFGIGRYAELPGELVFQLDEYFGKSMDSSLQKYLMKILAKGGYYKKQWFEKYGIAQDSDKFFEILDKNGFICDEKLKKEKDISEINRSGNNEVENQNLDESTDKNIDEQNDADLKNFKEILDQIGKAEKIDDKINFYVKALKVFYDFKNEKDFRSKMSSVITSGSVIAKGMESILEGISKGQRENIKTVKGGRRRFFTYDVGMTGYRVVLQDQDEGNRKIIVDFADHDTYDDSYDLYYKKY